MSAASTKKPTAAEKRRKATAWMSEPVKAGWLAPAFDVFFGGRDEAAGRRRFHYFRAGEVVGVEPDSACGNYRRPFIAFAGRLGVELCPRCAEAFTLNGKPVPMPPAVEFEGT